MLSLVTIIKIIKLIKTKTIFCHTYLINFDKININSPKKLHFHCQIVKTTFKEKTIKIRL